MKNLLNNVISNFKFKSNLNFRRYFSGTYEKNIFTKNINGQNFRVYDENIIGRIIFSKDKKNFSTFMKNVIEQVKKDMKENKQYQEALKELKEKTEINDKTMKLKKKIEENINFYKNIKEKNVEAIKILYNDVHNFVKYCFENNYILKHSKNISIQFFSILKKFIINYSDKFIQLKERWNDNSAFIQLDKWRQEMAIKRYKKKNKQENEKINESDLSENDSEQKIENDMNINEKNSEQKENNELILAYESAWDKFGSKLKDMPFLNNFFENPFIGKLFGETELAAALREMKMYDKNFKLSELMYLFEYVISKHIVESYLIGDEETLRLHCGSSAFNSLNASINERKKKKVYLDTNVLIYKNHELKGAQRMEESSPWFIFTFHTQQINCLKNKNDEIIEGKIDDIREVVYTIALSKHPEPEKEGLLYPYIVREFAIIGNTPSW
ncbi:mitochondrial import inner membrane translocase subunit TIM44, putative [Plasmodium gallinaceum]|uniref:Mitochondrial import inner membrane translocase subunit TIM44, putative n=1 Tax=Plasmodium gallinaceum TaxID=5849 RepID=A0A1J1GUW7_PLAGA|nr:mitochondrial import inner membrane translocase subunit TIM44, putative [Plasmodium gallinaceum]CRG96303.1 mitochondrial import inner membrane translocase subunit TIM44, putative [Plasmodium gallinaceum]